MKRTYEVLPQFPVIVLTPREVATLTKAVDVLTRLRELWGDWDDTLDTDLGRAQASLWEFTQREIDAQGRVVPR